MWSTENLGYDLRRLGMIVRAVLVYGVAYGPARALLPERLFERLQFTPPPRRSAPERLRLALENLGGTYLKLGQFLAMRYDILPARYCDELSKLFDDVPAFPTAEARKIIQQDLGEPVERLFADFEDQPLAAASFGQVYRATLSTGQRVAVKIQRPSIRRIVESDIRLLGYVVSLAKGLHLLGSFDPEPGLREFVQWTRDELDFTREASYAELLMSNASNQPAEIYPKVFWDQTSTRVLTTEFMSGQTLKAVISRLEAEGTSGLRREGIDVDRAARNLILNSARQLFISGIFHADPHPANMFILPGSKIGYVDFGIVGHLSPDRRQHFKKYIVSSASGNFDAAIDAMMRMASVGEATDLQAFRSEYRKDLRSWYHGESMTPHGTKASVAYVTFEIMGTMRRHGVSVPTDVISFFKTMMTIDSMVAKIAPTVNTESVIAQEFAIAESSPWHLAKDLLSFETWRSASQGSGRRFLRLSAAALPIARRTVSIQDASASGPLRRAANARARLPAAGALMIGAGVLFGAFHEGLIDRPFLWISVLLLFLPLALVAHASTHSK